MSYTNKTPNYDLPQYVADDKPTYLGDFNNAMSIIDTTLKANNDLAQSANNTANSALTTATTAESKATQADTKATTAESKAETAQSTAESAQSTAESAQSTAESAQSTAETATNSLNNFKNEFNFSNITSIPMNNITIKHSSGETITPVSNGYFMKVATNDTQSLVKIYGCVVIQSTHTTGSFTVSFPSNLRPTTKITINNLVALIGHLNNTFNDVSFGSVSIDTNGTISYSFTTLGTSNKTYILPSIIFFKDFGDTDN